jgi:hypothetical protein
MGRVLLMLERVKGPGRQLGRPGKSIALEASASADKPRPALYGKPLDVGESAGVVALHELGNAVDVENTGVDHDIAAGSAIIADDHPVMLAKPALDVMESPFTAVRRVAEHARVIGVNHVQGKKHQVLPVRALRRYGL